MTLKLIAVGASAAALLVAGCTTTDPYRSTPVRNNTGTGALVGAGVGALLGYLTNTSDSEEGRTNAMIGAGVGALAGAGIGNYMDRQQRALEQELSGTGVGVAREGDVLILRMPSDVTFGFNSDQVDARFYAVLDDVANVLNTYDQSVVDVMGHADSRGTDEYNQGLSERRAASVAGYLINRGVIRERLYVAGLGERSPIASNDTDAGRAANRRVEIVIRPFTGR
ncbi:OmpA family protein [Brevundimonas aveniformis]|uniref:OmpA family protein n=1 Tax=Brevundimonas aveniformis TaxID=370977 RepID=UPI000428772F|nr:OmpA family protein [Brevundimonas aveniformis]